MYGDTDVLRRRADQLREQALDIRTLADQLVARTESIGWTGRAADSMRVRVTERATHLRAAAAQHESAADSLAKHVEEVDHVKEVIAGTETRAAALVADATTRVRQAERTGDDGVRVDPDPDDVVLVAFTPPPPGHRDWLAVELPGL